MMLTPLARNLLDLRDTQPHGKDVNAASKIHEAADRMYKSCKQDDIPVNIHIYIIYYIYRCIYVILYISYLFYIFFIHIAIHI